MPVESAADRASLFSTDEFAVAARYTAPGGGSTDCTVIFDPGRPEPAEIGLGQGGLRAAIAEQSAQILADLVPSVVINGRLAIGADSYKITERPRLDETGAIWSVVLQKL